MAATRVGRRIRVRGLVQGVGFRPHVWRLAAELGLAGAVGNDGAGVEIEVWGEPDRLDLFLARLSAEAPPLARIDAVECEGLKAPPPPGFRIAASRRGVIRTGIVPDAATCPACLAELSRPGDRRQGYAFGNCTHCGPRLSIVTAIPYDRANTTMAPFTLCADCAAEYADPADRRFHAQPTACPVCGPRLWLEGEGAGSADPIAAAADLLTAGRILALKGIGGFHLACNALDAAAVAELRRRKARDDKPFALMAASPGQIERFCRIDPADLALLSSPAAPIVLLPLKPEAEALPGAIAPGQDHIGFMLPYSPLHHLLMARLGGPLVMTSGNRADEPQATDNEAARDALAGLADGWLMHDRAIVNRVDDSVVAREGDAVVMLRRARGFAPAPLALPEGLAGLPPVLAMGGQLKSTFCLIKDGQAILSPHIGDLSDAAAAGDYRAMLDLYRRLFDFTPDIVAIDLHGDYFSTSLGAALAGETGASLVRVGHHHAHMASCLADAGLGLDEAGEDCLGIILDGLGMGEDGTLWGGEILQGGYRSTQRVGYIAAVPLPGGAAAMREPWRNLLAHLRAAFGPDWRARSGPILAHLPDAERVRLVERLIETGTNSPVCSSAGRLFDAAAAALGLHAGRITHEAQAAMALEALARPHIAGERPYGWDWSGGAIGWAPLWRALLADIAARVEEGRIAARFHLTLIAALADGVSRLAPKKDAPVALSGGVLQNRIILAGLRRELAGRGFRPLIHRRLPAGDGGLSLGQAIIGGGRT